MNHYYLYFYTLQLKQLRMKKFTLLLMMAFCLSVNWTNAQIHQPERGKILPKQADLLKHSPDNPEWWNQDSTWYWKWLPGTSAWEKYEREIRLLDGQGNSISSTYIDWDETLSEWNFGSRYYNEYYSNNRIKNRFHHIWNKATGSWVDINHTFYDTDGKITETQQRNFDNHNVIYSGSQVIYTYGPSTLQMTGQTLDIITMTWINDVKTLETYDSDNRMISRVHQQWNSGTAAWVNVDKVEKTYNSLGNPNDEFYYDWNAVTSNWDINSRLTFQYNSSGWEISTYLDIWNASTSTFDNQTRTLSQFNPEGLVTQWLYETWNMSTQIYDNFEKLTYTYHPNGVANEFYSFNWDPIHAVFMDLQYSRSDTSGNNVEYYSKSMDYTTYLYTNGYRQLYTFDSYRVQLCLSQDLDVLSNTWIDDSRRTSTYDGNFNNTVELDEVYTPGTATWANAYKQEHFYSDFIGINDKPGVKDYCFFSNPIQAGQSINCPDLKEGSDYQITLINMRGQRVYNINLKAGGSFSVPSTMPAGTYVLQIIEKGKLPVSGKVIVVN